MTLFLFIVILSILIVVHEFGHFIAAKRAGVKVEIFSLGFGRKLWGRKAGDTEYTVRALPFGGYVKMAGDNPQDAQGASGEYLSASAGKRFRIIFFGPMFNYILGIFLFWIVFMAGYPRLMTTVGAVMDGMGAQESGILAGDRITAVEGSPVVYWEDLQREIGRRKERETLNVSVERAGSVLEFDIRIKNKDVVSPTGRKKRVGLLGITPKGDTIIVKAGPVRALGLSVAKTYELTVLTYESLWSIFTGRIAVRDSVTGPLGMLMITSEMSKLGLAAVLSFIALLSVSLGIFNLLPFPALDGGHLALLVLEKIRGRPLSRRSDEIFNRVGFGFIILLAALVFANDLVKFGFLQKAGDILGRILTR